MSNNRIWDLNNVSEVIKNSTNYSDVLRMLNLPPNRGNRQTLQHFINQNNIQTDHFKLTRPNNRGYNRRKMTEKDLIENCEYDMACVKGFIKREKLIDHTFCSLCKIQALNWNGKPLTMQLDHINGNRFDNRLENLRFICPNCHSQTETFGNKNKSKTVYDKSIDVKNCQICGLPCKSLQSKVCSDCFQQNKLKKFEVSKEELTKLVDEYPLTKIGEMFNVSDTAIRKRCEKLEVEIPLKRRKPRSKI